MNLIEIENRLKALGWSRAELARRVGITRQSLCAWLRGEKRLHPRTVARAIVALGGRRMEIIAWEGGEMGKKIEAVLVESLDVAPAPELVRALGEVGDGEPVARTLADLVAGPGDGPEAEELRAAAAAALGRLGARDAIAGVAGGARTALMALVEAHRERGLPEAIFAIEKIGPAKADMPTFEAVTRYCLEVARADFGDEVQAAAVRVAAANPDLVGEVLAIAEDEDETEDVRCAALRAAVTSAGRGAGDGKEIGERLRGLLADEADFRPREIILFFACREKQE